MFGTTGAYSEGGQYNFIVNQTAPQSVLIGQELDFSQGTWTSTPVTISRVVENTEEWSIQATNNRIVVSKDVDQWTKSGAFYVNYNATSKVGDAKLTVSAPSVPIDLKVETPTVKSVSSIAQGTILVVDTAGMNLLENDTVKLVIMKGGSQITEKADKSGAIQHFSPISVTNLTNWYGRGNGIDTTKFDPGTYTFQIKTDPAKACGLTAESAVKTLEVNKGKVEITADKTDVIELKAVQLTVTGVAGDNISVNASPNSSHVI